MIGSRFVLGTAQLGLAYGVANRHGKPGDAAAADLLAAAEKAGIPLIDTAIAYGDSESRLGHLGAGGRFAVMSKLPALPDGASDVGAWVRRQVEGSLERLGVRQLWALSFHRPEQLLGPQGGALYAAVQALRSEGLVERVGVSLYRPSELDGLFSQFEINLVQLPASIFDRRLEHSSWTAKLAASGCEVHVRSVFLQGLLLLPPNLRPEFARRWSTAFSAFDAWVGRSATTAVQACLGHVLAIPGVSRIVVGAEDAVQLNAILAAAQSPVSGAPDFVGDSAEDLIEPFRWPKH